MAKMRCKRDRMLLKNTTAANANMLLDAMNAESAS